MGWGRRWGLDWVAMVRTMTVWEGLVGRVRALGGPGLPWLSPQRPRCGSASPQPPTRAKASFCSGTRRKWPLSRPRPRASRKTPSTARCHCGHLRLGLCRGVGLYTTRVVSGCGGMSIGRGGTGRFVPCLGTTPLSCRKPTQAANAFKPAARAGPSFQPSASGQGPDPSLAPERSLWSFPSTNATTALSQLLSATLLSPRPSHAPAPKPCVLSPMAPSTWDLPSLPLQCHPTFKAQCPPCLLLQAVLPAQRGLLSQQEMQPGDPKGAEIQGFSEPQVANTRPAG